MTLNEHSIRSLLITGGTGSFGKDFIQYSLTHCPSINRLVVLSRDELKQWELQEKYPRDKYPQLRFFLGDIRDKDRIKRALEGVDTVVHAAALKQVPAAEYNPIEFIKTNIIGTENLIQGCLDQGVKKVVSLSTDKAAAPVNLYGATKLCSDKLMISSNNIKGSRETTFSVVRYGNVMGSRGSVIPYFIDQAKTGTLNITDFSMTRFNITLRQAIKMVYWSLENSFGGEVFVPKIPSYRITDVAKAISPSCNLKEVGIRPGEKLHEEMITSADAPTTIDIGNYYIIFPSINSLKMYEQAKVDFDMVPENFTYNSYENLDFLSVEDIRDLIKSNIDVNFKPI